MGSGDAMSQATSVVIGALIALISGLTSAALTLYGTSRREWIFRVREERRSAYESFLTNVRPYLDYLDERSLTIADMEAVIAVQDLEKEDPNRIAFNERLLHLEEEMGGQVRALRDATDRLELVAGTPVSAVALGFMAKLSIAQYDIRRFARAQAEGAELIESIAALSPQAFRHEVVRAMRTDLAEPWLSHLHDRSERRWWRFWERRSTGK